MSNITGPRLLTVLYADIDGYARLIEQDQPGTVVRLTHSIALIRTLIQDYGGTVANTAGDGIVAIFDSVQRALHFSLEMQRELSRDAIWSGGDTVIAYRIGISVGDTLISADGVYGHAVNLAARIQHYAKPGGVCISEPVYQMVRDDPALILTPLGPKALKNITAPMQVYAVSAAPDARPADLPPVTLHPESPRLPEASLAVLPLENISDDPNDGLICRGIAADLIADLSRFRSLMVIARHSSTMAAAQAQSLPEIGTRLGVRYLLSGSFRRMEQRIRITVELAEAANGNVIWSERYDGDLAELFRFQDDVVASTASRVAILIDAAERRRLNLNPHPQLYSYGLVLRGQEMATRYRADANLHARRLFEQARTLDPKYGRSYAEISRTFNLEWRYRWSTDPALSLQHAVEIARQAAACDPMDSRGFAELGFSQLYSKQHDEALAAYDHALALNPNDADLLCDAGSCLTYVRQLDRALQLLERAMRLNPYHPDSYFWALGGAYFNNGDYEKAIQTAARMCDQSEGHRLMAASYALLGQMNEARHHACEVMRVHPNFTVGHWQKVPPYAYAADIEPFVTGLRLSGLN